MKQRVRMLSLLPLVTFIMVAMSLLQPLSASAASSKIHSMGTRQNAKPDLGSGNLQYHGGPVMGGTTKVYAIYWEPSGSFVDPNYNSLLNRYFGDVGGSSLYHNNTQYKDSKGNIPSGSHLAASWVDTANYPGNPISDAQVQQEVTHAKKVNSWTSSIHNVFFVFTAKGENICNGSSCSFSTFCAYHGFFGSNTLYAAMPYTGTNLSACGVSTSPNHDFDADSTINVTSHEQIEAATDPLLNAWFDAAGFEIGDKCAWIFGSTKSYGGDIKMPNKLGHPYEVQKEWDNAKSACELAGP